MAWEEEEINGRPSPSHYCKDTEVDTPCTNSNEMGYTAAQKHEILLMEEKMYVISLSCCHSSDMFRLVISIINLYIPMTGLYLIMCF